MRIARRSSLVFVCCLLLLTASLAVLGPTVALCAGPQPVPTFSPRLSRALAIEQRARDLSDLPHTAVARGAHRDVPLSSLTAERGPLVRDESRELRAIPRWWELSGSVLDFDGSAIPDAEVSLWVTDFWDQLWGAETTSDYLGRFGFSGSPEGSAEVDVDLPSGSAALAYQAWDIPVYDGASPSIDLHPGLVPFSTTRTSIDGWDHWNAVEVQTWGSKGGADAELGSSGSAHVMPPDYGYACVYYFWNQGAEWNADGSSEYPVSAGGWGGTPIRLDQDDAQSVLILNRWASGKPGSAVRYGLGNWPYGYEADLWGYSEDPNDDRVMDYRDFFSPGESWGYWVSLRIPKTAKPGYAYVIWADRADQDSGLALRDYFQVCTLKASRTKIRRGAAIRLSGIIPTQGHWGSQSGRRKTVTVYARTRSAGQPSTWKPGKGWKKVCTCKASGYGKYRSKLLRPKRNTWYVVRYPGDSWYWGAYTSVIKVRVR